MAPAAGRPATGRGEGPGQEVLEPSGGLLRASRGELSGRREGDQHRQDEEAHAEHGRRAASRRAELGEHLLHR